MSDPCDTCCRVHRGPRCKPDEHRSISITITLPRHVHRELTEHIPWGERSQFVTHAIKQALP